VAKKQTFTLDFKPDYDFLLLGIFCAYRDYKLCAELNRHLQYNFEKLPDLEIRPDNRGSSYLFPYFFYLNEDEEEIYLISNKGNKYFFIPELKQCDYFLVIKNQSRYTTVEELERKIRFISIVSSTFEIEPSELKSAENFLFLEPNIDKEPEKPKLPPVK